MELSHVATALANSDRLLIVAAAGLSISDTLPNNPYHSPADFARHYPACARFGYRTSYHAMGLGRDERVPAGVRLACTALAVTWNRTFTCPLARRRRGVCHRDCGSTCQ